MSGVPDREALKEANPSLAGLIDLMCDCLEQHDVELTAATQLATDNGIRADAAEASLAEHTKRLDSVDEGMAALDATVQENTTRLVSVEADVATAMPMTEEPMPPIAKEAAAT